MVIGCFDNFLLTFLGCIFSLQCFVLLVWNIYLRIYLGYNWSCFLLHCLKSWFVTLCQKRKVPMVPDETWRDSRIHQYVSILPFGEDSEKAANRKVQRFLKNVKIKWIGRWERVIVTIFWLILRDQYWIRGHYIEHHQFLFRCTAATYN